MDRKGFTPVIILLFVGILIMSVFVMIIFQRKDVGVDRLSSNAQRWRRESDCQSNPQPVFTYAPTDISSIKLISPPIMKVSSGIKSHSYIETTKPSPVYAPADSTLVTGAKYTESSVDPQKVQYVLLFRVSCEVSYYYDHLIDVSEKIAGQFPKEPQVDNTRSNERFSVEVKAGELIGYSWSRQFDFGVLDNTTEPALEEFDEYKGSEKAYAVCPLKFFTDDIKNSMSEKLGYFDSDNLLVIDNLCD